MLISAYNGMRRYISERNLQKRFKLNSLEGEVSEGPRRVSWGKRMLYAGMGALMMIAPAISLCCAPGDEKENARISSQVSDDDSVYNNGGGNGDDDSERDPNCTYPEPGAKYNVVECEDFGGNWSGDYMCDSTADYFDFLKETVEYARPISKEKLQKKFRDIDSGKVSLITKPMSASQMKSELIDKLNINFLVNELDSRELEVTIANREDSSQYTRYNLIFKDPYVGEFEAILLEPLNGKNNPAIIAMHGHGDNATIFMQERYGKEYPSQNYAIMMPTTRIMCGGSSEGVLSRDFLLNGFGSFMTVRMYETLLSLKYLRSRAERYGDIDSENIGLIGHSGGATLSNLTMRVEDSFGAYVSDNSGIYHRSLEERGGYEDNYFDDMVPDIYPFHLLINDLATSNVPAIHVDYGYKDEKTGKSLMPQVFEFFDAHLKD